MTNGRHILKGWRGGTGDSGDPPTVAVVGLGYWGPNLLRVLIERTDVRVGWICDTDPTRYERLIRRYPTVRATTNLDEVLDDPEVDGVRSEERRVGKDCIST